MNFLKLSELNNWIIYNLSINFYKVKPHVIGIVASRLVHGVVRDLSQLQFELVRKMGFLLSVTLMREMGANPAVLVTPVLATLHGWLMII